MDLIIDTSKKSFMCARGFQPKVDMITGVLKTERNTGKELNTIQLMVRDQRGAEVIQVTVAGPVQEVPVDTPVTVVDLEAIPWNNNGRSGVAFRATSVTPVHTGRSNAA
jgi:hypothetical protein